METVETLLRDWDGESLILTYDRQSGSWIIIAIHSTVLGPAAGGTRMKPYENLEEAIFDAHRLAAGMTYKWAVAGLEMGGGKAVLAVKQDMGNEDRTGLLSRYGALLQKLGGMFLTGPDLGTSVEDMDVIGLSAPSFVFGKSPAAGGAGDPAPFTALGVYSAMEVTAKYLFGEPTLEGRRVVIQGIGSVGRVLAGMLCDAQAEVLISDLDDEAIDRCSGDLGLTNVTPAEVYDVKCDFFAPCAIGGVLNENTIARLDCLAIVGAANNQLAEAGDALSLLRRGILYAPDFVTNCGGAVAITGIETRGWTSEEATNTVRQSVRQNLGKIYEISESQGITTHDAALALARERLNQTAD
jgi:leucine dehydrogenase